MARSGRPDYDIVHAQLRDFVRRVGLLLAMCDEIECDGLVLVSDEDWIEIYRLLIELHERLANDVDAGAVKQHLLSLGLKLAVLEALVETAAGSLRTKILH